MLAFEYNLIKKYSWSINRDVGYTNNAPGNGSYPVPVPTDANSIFVAGVTGNDANPGTFASQVKTLRYAITLSVFPAKMNIVISETVTETGAAPISLQSTSTLQGSQIDIAVLNLGDARLEVFGSSKTFGIYISANETVINCSNPTDITGNNFAHCTFVSFSELTSLHCITGNFGKIENCFFYYRGSAILYPQSRFGFAPEIRNCIFKNYNPTVFFNNSPIQYTTVNPIFSPEDFIIHSCMFVDSVTAISFQNIIDNPVSEEIIITSSSFINSETLIESIFDPPLRFSPGVTLNNCYVETEIFQGVNYVNLGDGITNNNQVNVRNPLLVSYPDVIDVSTESNIGVSVQDTIDNRLNYRLQRIGSPYKDYFINSPLIKAGLFDFDISPFEILVSPADYSFEKSEELKTVPLSLNIETIFSNSVEKTDVQGNLDVSFDSLHYKLSFDFSDTTAITNNDIWKFLEILQDTGTKRFYPKGFNGNMFPDVVTGSTDGIFNNIYQVFTPDLTEPMFLNHWKDYWIIIDNREYYIGFNDSTSFHVYDLMKQGVISLGSHSFEIKYLTVNTPVASFQILQNLFTQFACGGIWRENINDFKEHYQYAINNITLQSVGKLTEKLIEVEVI